MPLRLRRLGAYATRCDRVPVPRPIVAGLESGPVCAAPAAEAAAQADQSLIARFRRLRSSLYSVRPGNPPARLAVLYSVSSYATRNLKASKARSGASRRVSGALPSRNS